MKKNSVLRKALAVSLAAAMLAGTGFTATGSYIGTSVSVSAAETYSDFQYNVNNDNTITITKYTGNGENVVIPSTIDGKVVTGIGGWAFFDLHNIISVDIPEGVKSIGDSAFSYCLSLKNITIPESVEMIGDYAFGSCFFITDIFIPKNVAYIGNGVFYECMSMAAIDVDSQNPSYSSQNGVLFDKDKTTVISYPKAKYGAYIIPDGVMKIKDGNTFRGCVGLTSISIPYSLTEMPFAPFEGCAQLTSINVDENNPLYFSDSGVLCERFRNSIFTCPQAKAGTYSIPDGINTINDGAFRYCVKLTNITISNSVTAIKSYAFENCTGLTKITVPDSVTEIGSYVFYGCTGLTIYGTKGSYAEIYANKNNIPFVSDISSKEIVLGETVTINAKAVLGEGDYTYAVLYKKKADTKWTVKQNYSTNDTIVVKPAKATDYDVCVKVKDSTGKIIKKFFEVKVNAKLKNTSTISAATIKKGEAVTLNGSATGGMGEYTYAALYKKKAETKWTTRQGYKDNSEILVRPYTNTDYDICIKVKDKNGTIAKKYFTVTVTK